jgi:hypothetical protein
MFNKFLYYTISFLLFGLVVQAQEISSLKYSGQVVIPYGYKVNGNTVGGLSGITFNSNNNSYYLVADKPPARIFKVIINNDQIHDLNFVETSLLAPALLSNSELEGIAYNYVTGNYYVSDEQKSGTRILELNNEAKFVRIIEPVNQSFLPLSGHNSGLEGLTISDDLKYLYYAFERPTDECFELSLVKITKKELSVSANYETYYYQLHHVENDKLNTNGLSDILFLNDFRLLILERAFIPGQGNIVRLYVANLEGRGSPDKEVNCNDESIIPLTSKLLFDFNEVSAFKIDNAEGMTFNADKSKLFIVTDNNFSKKQETQIIVLDVTWE